MMDEVLLLHAAATVFMAGLIWFVQVVHYPLMDRVKGADFAIFAGEHARRTTWVVGPPMIAEVVLAGIILRSPPPSVPAASAWLAAFLLLIIWLTTARVQVPQHRRLAQGFDVRTHRRLVAGNWIRTLAWTARACLALSWLD